MKRTILILSMTATAAAAIAQTPAKPAGPAKSTAGAAVHSTAVAAIKLPPGVPPVNGIVKTAFSISLRYQDSVVGSGVLAEPGKLLKYHFTLWLAGDGRKIESSHDHPGQPLKDKDGKPVLGDDGKPKLGDPEAARSVMGTGRPLAGWDMGFEGMKAGGSRRIFIPWQLGLGAREIPAHGVEHPAIPAKSDLILDVELLDVTDVPASPPYHGMMPEGHPMGGMSAPPKPGVAGAPAAQPNAPGAPNAPNAPAAPASPAAPAAPGAPASPAQPQMR